MKKIVPFVGALVASFVSLCSQADVPMIRFASGVPFKDGKCVEEVWAKADVCTRFVEVNKNDVALDPSEVSILFDERNLYVALKGCFDPQYDRGDAKKGMSSVNNFEFLLKPPAGEYLHVIVDELHARRQGAQLRRGERSPRHRNGAGQERQGP